MAAETTVARERKAASANVVGTASRTSGAEYRKIINILEKRSPTEYNALREFEEMSDKELTNFYAFSVRSTYNYGLNQMTREKSREWSNLALDEMRNRRRR